MKSVVEVMWHVIAH